MSHAGQLSHHQSLERASIPMTYFYETILNPALQLQGRLVENEHCYEGEMVPNGHIFQFVFINFRSLLLNESSRFCLSIIQPDVGRSCCAPQIFLSTGGKLLLTDGIKPFRSNSKLCLHGSHMRRFTKIKLCI